MMSLFAILKNKIAKTIWVASKR